MSNKSNNEGRAFEFACLKEISSFISKYGKVSVVKNSSFDAANRAWDSTPLSIQDNLIKSAKAGCSKLIDLEPMLKEGANILLLKLQSDEKGEEGDVRDILLIKEENNWEIGLSVKHNHFAVKHSRLSDKIDFAEKWFGFKCSQNYWEEIQPIFEMLTLYKKQNKKWSEIDDKDKLIYVPLLKAFINEINLQYSLNGYLVPKRMVEYLLGKFDFYKLIGIDAQKKAEIETFNLHGALNKASKNETPKIKIPISKLPSRIISIGMKPNSTNTVELYLDEYWGFTFRIHNASTYVEKSLKFDIQLAGIPITILKITCPWS